jgi:hypothetical protein
MRDDRLTCTDIKSAGLVSDPQHSFQHDCEFLELGHLSGLNPASRTFQESDADLLVTGIDSTDVFVNHNGFVAGRINSGRFGDKGWHFVDPCGN